MLEFKILEIEISYILNFMNFQNSLSKHNFGNFAKPNCFTCGGMMNTGVGFVSSSEKVEVEDGFFVQGGSKFLVSDDLKMMPSSLDNSLQLLIQLGYRDFSGLEETFINVDLQEVIISQTSFNNN